MFDSLEDLKKVRDSGSLPPGELCVILDNDSVLARVHPGWDEDGEERGDPVYVWESQSPREALKEALALLGLSTTSGA